MGNIISVRSNEPVRSATVSDTVSSSAGILFQDDFSIGDLSKWSYTDSGVSFQSVGGINNSAHVRIDYAAAGTSPHQIYKNISSEGAVGELYVKFNFMTDGGGGGCKFCKFESIIEPTGGWANCSFWTTDNNRLEEIGYGNGSSITNDAQNKIKYDGTRGFVGDDPLVVYEVALGKFTPTQGTWHEFQGYMKYNTDGQRDGVFKVWIDGALRVHVTNVKNRHDSNSRTFRQVRLADYSAFNYGVFDLHYDNVVFSNSFIT